MSDMKQVAERLRSAVKNGEWVAYDAEPERQQMHMDDEHDAAIDWLAERDPTPLAVEVIEQMIAANEQPAKEWLAEWYESISIRNHKLTVGELRTLARLARVELTKGGE
jgi:hypothetical protein